MKQTTQLNLDRLLYSAGATKPEPTTKPTGSNAPKPLPEPGPSFHCSITMGLRSIENEPFAVDN